MFEAASLFPLLMGLVQTGVGSVQSNNLANETAPQFSLTPGMQRATNIALSNIDRGFTPAERAAYDQKIASSGNTAFRRGVEMAGGNLGGALNAAVNSQQIDAQNNMAIADANARRANFAQSVNVLGAGQNAQDQNTSNDYNRLMTAQQAWGQTTNDGLHNLYTGFQTQFSPQKNAGTNLNSEQLRALAQAFGVDFNSVFGGATSQPFQTI